MVFLVFNSDCCSSRERNLWPTHNKQRDAGGTGGRPLRVIVDLERTELRDGHLAVTGLIMRPTVRSVQTPCFHLRENALGASGEKPHSKGAAPAVVYR